MKKVIFIPLIIATIGGSLFYAKELNKPITVSFIPAQQQKALAEVIKITGITEKIRQYMKENNASLDESIIKITQQEWLRKPEIVKESNTKLEENQPPVERWEMAGLHEDKASQLMPSFTELGMCTAKLPSGTNYTYGIMLGALAPTVVERLKFLDTVCSQGVTLKHIVLLSGKRVLTPEEKVFLKESYKCNEELKYETDMIVYILQQTNVAPTLKKLPCSIVDAPEPSPGRRPTTNDTVDYWLQKYNPTSGSCLAVSTNPFIPYQDTALKTLLPKSFTIETIGSLDPRVASGNKRVALLLDSLARWLYQENERQKK